LCPQWEKRTIRHTTGQIYNGDFNQGRSIVKKFWLCAALIIFWPALGFAQTTDELVNDGKNSENVTTQSMGYDRKSYSPLKQINKSNVKRLVPLWSTSLMSDQGELAAPTIYNGVMYVINGKWTFAIDVETGRQIWRTPVRLEPASRRAAFHRGAATIYNGKLFRVTIDNHVLALDMETGKELWNQKFADVSDGYYATGGPIIANGVLISGMAGGESTTRGFLDGWDPDTGKKLWRRYTIPAPGEPGSETWPKNSDAWTQGGGPTWRSGSYDPQLDLVYWGTGNAEPYDPRPREGLDSLYTSSVLAIRPKTGEIACYYQYTPNDLYDVDGTDENVLADIQVGGQLRKVMIQTNKNGFLYVVDRTNCKLIAAHPYVKVNWASEIDLKTGRPVLTDVHKRFLAGEEGGNLAVARNERRAHRVRSEHGLDLRKHVECSAHSTARAAETSRGWRGLHWGGGQVSRRQARGCSRSFRGDQSTYRREEMGGPTDRSAQLGRNAGHRRRACIYRQTDG
jgi:alcohol dehydrogenase (cytochrome c)